MHSNSRVKLLILEVKVSSLGIATSLASVLATIFNKKVAKIKTSFLATWLMSSWLSNSSFNYNFSKLTDLSYKLVDYNFYYYY